mgnify:CR=1 FL=1
MTDQVNVYKSQGGDSLTVASGGTLTLEAGSTFTDSRFNTATTSAADSLAIPVTHRYVAKTTGADGEALTLANGTPGQVLTISLVTDGGGDGTLTPATSSGWATIVFADAGDTATLEYVDDTTGWIVVGLAGVSAAPAMTV